jgi:hypothetical protein
MTLRLASTLQFFRNVFKYFNPRSAHRTRAYMRAVLFVRWGRGRILVCSLGPHSCLFAGAAFLFVRWGPGPSENARDAAKTRETRRKRVRRGETSDHGGFRYVPALLYALDHLPDRSSRRSPTSEWQRARRFSENAALRSSETARSRRVLPTLPQHVGFEANLSGKVPTGSISWVGGAPGPPPTSVARRYFQNSSAPMSGNALRG